MTFLNVAPIAANSRQPQRASANAPIGRQPGLGLSGGNWHQSPMSGPAVLCPGVQMREVNF